MTLREKIETMEAFERGESIEAKAKIEEQVAIYGFEKPKNLEEQALSIVGKDIYEQFIKEYTEKQWGRKATDLPAFIIKRIPIRFTFDNNYFNDKYQGIPTGGYNKIILVHDKKHISLKINKIKNLKLG